MNQPTSEQVKTTAVHAAKLAMHALDIANHNRDEALMGLLSAFCALATGAPGFAVIYAEVLKGAGQAMSDVMATASGAHPVH